MLLKSFELKVRIELLFLEFDVLEKLLNILIDMLQKLFMEEQFLLQLE
jgi:hypothetical protein